jgi:hypothetical protein
MSGKFNELLQVKLPGGAKERLAEIAARNYETPASVARKIIMGALERAQPEEAKKVA